MERRASGGTEYAARCALAYPGLYNGGSLMRMTAFIDNEREVMKKLRELSDGALRSRVYRAMEEAGEQVAVEARIRAPRRTGALASSIKTFGNEKALTVKVYVGYPHTVKAPATPEEGPKKPKKRAKKRAKKRREYYAMAVEYGTKHVRAQPFLFPALEAKARMIAESIDAAIEGALNDTVGSV
jgi:HK97 gp10 family phage protein